MCGPRSATAQAQLFSANTSEDWSDWGSWESRVLKVPGQMTPLWIRLYLATHVVGVRNDYLLFILELQRSPQITHRLS